jgi:cellulose synthase/poly-beta-1,6-N-acetylglucosamine synthase-like glycosyltransferase
MDNEIWQDGSCATLFPASPVTPVTEISAPSVTNTPVAPVANIPIVSTPVTPLEHSPVTPSTAVPITPMIDVPLTPPVIADRPAVRRPAPQPYKQPAIADPRTRERVKYYERWLAKQANYDAQNDDVQEINQYVEEAAKVVKVGGQEVAIFAPYRPKLSALQTFTTPQVIVFFAIAALWIAGLLVFHLAMLSGVIAVVTVLYFFNLILNVSMALRTFRNSPEEHISDEIVHALKDVDWPVYTILCPLYREAQVVPQFVQAMQALDYPADKLQILFLTEADDVETRNAIRALSLPPHFSIVVVPDGKPRTKPRACNYGLMQARGRYVVIYDAEDIPDPLQLKKAVLTFANHDTDVVCVQAKLNFYNIRQNILTRWFTAEYSAWFDLILPGLQLANFPLPLGGTSNHFRTSVLRALGGWDAYNVTEDCDLGLRLKRYRMNTVILDSTTLEEANPQLKNWIRQRSRWIKGYMQTYLVHMRNPFEYFRKGRLYDMFAFQTVIGSGTAVMFVNPIMWVLLGLYIALGPAVLSIYHRLFSGPTLYMGAFCLIFGNFFYIYIYMLACMKRKQYHLLPWTLFIPVYWLLMSIAAFYALFELIVKPHYWQKTVHGLHLKGNQAAQQPAQQAKTSRPVEEPTLKIQAIPNTVSDASSIPSVTSSLRAISTLILPAISKNQKQAQRVAIKSRVRDLWLIASVTIACITSIVTTWYYAVHHEILLYQDSLSHMRISRGVFDSLTPGLAQLGSVWLPLPHILMWPFIWNDTLWHSGLAGSFVSMPCYVIAATCLFLTARRLTGSSSASFIGTLIYIFNPNVLYLQSTPMSETVCMATFALAAYFFLCWTQEGDLRQLVISATCTFLATLARYDGWALFVAALCCIALIGFMKRQRFLRIQANLVIFGLMGGLGIGLWFLWNKLIFGDPLYFQKSLYSSQAQQSLELLSGKLFSYHNLWQSIRFYTIDAGQTVGWLLMAMAAIGVIMFVIKSKFTPTTVAGLLFLVPFPFYILALYGGQAIIWLPGANPPNANVYMYNTRYGAQMVLPVALFISILIERLVSFSPRRWQSLSHFMFTGILVAQCLLISFQGVISLQDSQHAYACEPQRVIVQYLAEHYNGGRILQDVYASQFDASDAGIDFHNIIYEGSAQYWIQALQNPASSVEWVIITPHIDIDPVAQRASTDPLFLSQFVLVAKQPNGVLLYHNTGEAPLPSRPPLPIWNGSHAPCS